MPYVIREADACFAGLKDIPMFTMTYPNKVFDYMAGARPTILSIDGVIREVIEACDGVECLQALSEPLTIAKKCKNFQINLEKQLRWVYGPRSLLIKILIGTARQKPLGKLSEHLHKVRLKSQKSGCLDAQKINSSRKQHNSLTRAGAT